MSLDRLADDDDDNDDDDADVDSAAANGDGVKAGGFLTTLDPLALNLSFSWVLREDEEDEEDDNAAEAEEAADCCLGIGDVPDRGEFD